VAITSKPLWKMFSTIQRPWPSSTMITLSLFPPPISTNGSSSAPLWIASGAVSIAVMRPA